MAPSGAAGCGPSAEQLEARRLVQLIDQVRDAQPELRDKPLAKLEQAEVRGAAASRARRHCLDAYQALRQGKQLESQVRRQLAFPSPSPTVAADLAKAERQIDKATAEMPRCNEALAALRRLAR